MDVWSRTAPRYRRRSIALLCLDLLFFMGLCCFAYWLRTGWPFPFQDPNYATRLVGALGFSPHWSESPVDAWLGPVGIDEMPAMMIVHGLLLSALISIPLLVAILYRLPASVLFVLAVAFLAVWPWLAASLLIGCVIASGRPFRFRFRFVPALLGLLPVGLYFLLICQRPAQSPEVALFTPVEILRLFSPPLLAVVGCSISFGVVLGIARWVNYRPGAIAPMLVILFAVPVVFFDRVVGSDELYYRVLEDSYRHVGQTFQERYVGDSTVYSPPPVAEQSWLWPFLTNVDRERVTKWLDQLEPLDTLTPPNDGKDLPRFAWTQYRLCRQCDKFIAKFSDSRYVSHALYLKGRVLDLRADRLALSRDRILRFHQGFPNALSEGVWKTILAEHPDTPFASTALLQLGRLYARAGRLDEADQLLAECIERLRAPPEEPAAEQPGRWDWLTRRRPTRCWRDVNPVKNAEEARTLRELILSNRHDPQFGTRPLVAFLQLDPRDLSYRRELRALQRQYAGSIMDDNYAVARALAETSITRRIELLQEAADTYDRQDAAPSAIYYLASELFRDERFEEARVQYQRLVTEYPAHPYVEDARLKLASIELQPTTQVARRDEPPPAGQPSPPTTSQPATGPVGQGG